ncbi:MAG: glycosyl transferase family 2 [Proteobacteria bacterium]|nr:MAG: glycosyl transferase family 2 [Pseudomonadota bacterium]
MSQVDIILVSYNTAEYTIRAIESVFEQTRQTDVNLIVVDNASSDDSVTRIRQKFPDIMLIETGKNLGFAGGVNVGAKAGHAEYILLLNPDTIILDGAIDKLVAFSKNHPNAGVWGGVTLNNDLSLNPNNARARICFSTLLFSALGLSKIFNTSCFFNHDNYGCWDRKSERDVDVVTGCFFLTPRALWESLEGLDDTFFMYAEEADYCIRAMKKGHQPRVTPDARIIHHGGVSEVNLSGKMIKLLKGKSQLIKKHEPAWKQPIYKSLLLLHVFNKYLSSSIIALIKKDKQALRNEWRTIFQQRQNWLAGYQ